MFNRNIGRFHFAVLLMLLIVFAKHHLHYSIADTLMRAVGLSPWSNAKYNTGVYIPNVVGLIVIGFVIILTSNYYRPLNPKILRTLILSSIAFAMIFPFVTEQTLFLVKHNSSGIHSFDYDREKSRCSYSSKDNSVIAKCDIAYFNYGKENNITIKPFFKRRNDGENLISSMEFEARNISISPHTSGGVGADFISLKSIPEDYSSMSGSPQEVGVEITINGVTKIY
ncbi:hypothetical protein [Cohnella abietis]|uniref:Uncharacterized protein n=1 Tax=Cohnella abietis TaxID=2507935 RepID=A0A3T1D6P1_9BACL|nr:hypothetical protein [Cohnella abietis]BBI33750.1 hypothetical protein KCTCHS21_31490 [Cohnella abietis]